MGSRFPMPNTPRDVDAEERKRLIMKKRLEQDRDAFGRGAQPQATLPPQQEQGMGSELMEIIGNMISGGRPGPGGGAPPPSSAPNPSANSGMNLMHAKALIEPETPDRAIPPFKSFPIGAKEEDVLTDQNFPFPAAGPQAPGANPGKPPMGPQGGGGGLSPDARVKIQQVLKQKRGMAPSAPAPAAQGMPNKLPVGPQSRQVNFNGAPPMSRQEDEFPGFVGGDQGGFSEEPVGRTTNLPSENPGTETLVPPVDGDFRAPPQPPEDQRGDRARDYLEQSMMRAREPSSLPYADLLMRSAAQVGTLGGKHADTQPFTDFTKNLQGEEYKDDDRRAKIAEYLSKKNQAKAGALKDDTFNREKLAADERRWNADRTQKEQQYENEQKKLDIMYQNMLNQAKNQEEANRINADYRKSAGALNEARANALEGSGGLRKKELELKEKDLGLKERDLNLKEKTPPVSKLSEGKKKYVADLETKTAAQAANLNLIQSYLDQFNKATSEQDKARIAGMMAKPLNGLAGQDAVGVEEVNRLMEATKQIHLGRAFDGKNPFGRDLDGFRRQVEAVLRTAHETVGRNTKEIENMTSGGGIGQTLDKPPKSPSGKVAPNIDGSLNYDDMSVEQLEELAKSRGIK